jgi:CBS domain-containing protein
MPHGATFESFQGELARLVEIFSKNLTAYKSAAYDEASLRQEFLNPLFRALGWDIENKAGLILQHREVEIESRTQIGGRRKRADYLFRTHPTDRFVCEAKKAAEELHAAYAFQAKRYAWNKGLALAVLTDFEEMKMFIVGGKPFKDEPDVGLWKTWHFSQYPAVAQEIWNLLSRERVAAGSIDQLIESLPKRPTGKGKAKQGWLIKPDRSRALDTDFLNFLDEARRELASDLLHHNDRADLLEGTQLNEAVQRILDRILFLRICEDRDIDTGRPLDRLVRSWRDDGDPAAPRRARQQPLELHEEPPAHYGGSGLRAPKGTLWHTLVRHFRSLDRRPPSHIPFFNGNLFKPHFSEELVVSDDWLGHFLDELGDEESPYLFSYIPVEILGTIYERFLGKVVRPHGRGVTIEEKPEVRKAGGVYYTPRYIVEYIVGQTVGKLLAGRKPEDALKLRILDPACGSGSFLIRAFEVVCEHCQQWLTDHSDQRKKDWCWLDEKENALHLTTKAKRRILRETIHGVDIDPQAVEVTQLSLYLKMLEHENRATLAHERDLFGSEDALLPPLENNIKCGNSLIASDFSMMGEDLVRVHAFDWPVQFSAIMKAGGFDAIIGNPPWGALFTEAELEYLRGHHREIIVRMIDSFMYFAHASVERLRKGGSFGMILPDVMLYQTDTERLRKFFTEKTSLTQICNMGDVFDQVTRPACIVICVKATNAGQTVLVADFTSVPKEEKPKRITESSSYTELEQGRISQVPGCLFTTSGFGNYPLWERVSSCPSKPLADLVDDDGIQRGVSPDLKEAFLVDRKTAKAWKLEADKLRPVLTGGKQVKRYDINRPDLLLIYTGRDDNYQRLPRICAYIDQFRKQITCKEVQQRKHSLYSLHRAREERIFLKPRKLVGVITEDEIVLALDGQRTFVTDGLYVFGLKPAVDIRYVMGVMNSRLFVSIYRLLSLEEGRALAQVKPTVLGNLPIRTVDFGNPADRARHDRLVGLVDKMLGLTPKLRAATTDTERQALQNAVTATDQQIDALVYELYGLTEAEKRLVEGEGNS